MISRLDTECHPSLPPHTCTHTHVHTHTHTHTHICIHTHTRMHTYTHTHTKTQTHPPTHTPTHILKHPLPSHTPKPDLHKDRGGDLDVIHAPHAGWTVGVLKDRGVQPQSGQLLQPTAPLPTALHAAAKAFCQQRLHVSHGQQELRGQSVYCQDDARWRRNAQSHVNLYRWIERLISVLKDIEVSTSD